MKLLYGVGSNDADYTVQPIIDGVKRHCPYYTRWTNMLRRCYSEAGLVKNPTYVDCSVCDEWLTFSNFKAWMETQDWEGKDLDKDLLVAGNKVYAPDRCLFVDKTVNRFLTRSQTTRGSLPIGVMQCKKSGKFIARIQELGSGIKYLASCSTPEEAHQVWLDRKRQLAKELAALQTDQRVAKALLETKYEDFA